MLILDGNLGKPEIKMILTNIAILIISMEQLIMLSILCYRFVGQF